jgi:ATP-dependent NAD(P)H-hydrate dehydratase
MRWIPLSFTAVCMLAATRAISASAARRMSTGAGSSSSSLATIASDIVPRFTSAAHKGSHGKVAVVGGSFEYTGAPYYAAISSLKTGADLSWVVCTEPAGTPIKSYCPELIVLPALPDSRHPGNATVEGALAAFGPLLDRLDALVVGPGLGRDRDTLEAAGLIIAAAARRNLPLVLDGDGLFLLFEKPGLLGGYSRAVLTPNAVEFGRLMAAAGPKEAGNELTDEDAATELSRRYGGVTVLKKGARDVAAAAPSSSSTSSSVVGVVDSPGSLRRCGGQGDVLAGTIGTFLAWARAGGMLGKAGKGKKDANASSSSASTSTSTSASVAADGSVATAVALSPSENEVLVASALAAARLTRRAAAGAFVKHRRSTTTPDIIAELGAAFDAEFPGTLFPSPANDEDDE